MGAAKTAAKGGKDAKGKDKGKGLTKKVDPLKKAGKTKAKKKSWTKVKVKDKLNNDVFLDEKLGKDATGYPQNPRHYPRSSLRQVQGERLHRSCYHQEPCCSRNY